MVKVLLSIWQYISNSSRCRNDKEKSIANAILSNQNNWLYVFKDFLSSDQYGKKYQFSIKEENIDRYTLTSNMITCVNNGKYWKILLTNKSYINSPVTPPIVKTNDSTSFMIPVIGLFVSMIVIISVYKAKKKE